MKSEHVQALAVVAFGLLLVYSASANPPGGSCAVDRVEGHDGLALNSDGTIDYYDGCLRHPMAVPIFLTVNAVGLSLVGVGILWTRREGSGN